MVCIRVSVVALVILLTSAVCNGQIPGKYQGFLNNLVTKVDDPRANDTGNVFYIIVSGKTCSKCFTEVCDYATGDSNYKNFKIVVIGTIPYNLLSLLPTAKRYLEFIPCTSEIAFHYTEDKAYPEIYDTPSPQLIIKQGDKLEYVPYGKTLQMVHSEGDASMN